MVLRGLTFALFHVDKNGAPRERAVCRADLGYRCWLTEFPCRVSLLSFLAA